MPRYRIGADIGGTFTDIVVLEDEGGVVTRKIPSSTEDYARAVAEGIAGVVRDEDVDPGAVAEVRHGTTVASNAILEGAGARTGLITTEGFRDVLEIRNLRMPRLYDLTWEKPPPLVPRRRRMTVRERIAADGTVRVPLDRASVEAAVDRLVAQDVEVIAVCLLNAYANPEHERSVRDVVAERAPDVPCCISFDVLPEIKEYERTSTTVVNAYVMPVVTRYVRALAERLRALEVAGPLLLMQSNGGLTTAEDAARLPCNVIESGPAGGVVGAQALAATLGIDDIVTFDMGGTTAKAALVEGGVVNRSPEYSVGGGIMIGSRLLTGAGYQLRVPAVDLAEVGAGGGSLVWIDAGGSMRVGPRSAGASPGPVCYGQGGTEPTITDANVILGYLNPEHLVGGELRLDAALAREVFEARVARRLDIDLAHAAYGAHRIAAANMIRAIKAVSSERGRDPRRYTLVAFGGNGPLFAAGMAETLGIGHVLVPPAPGLFSSFGLLYADVEHHYSRTLRRTLADADPAELEAAWSELESRARAQLVAEGYAADGVRIDRSANLHYRGQIYELTVPVPAGVVDLDGLRRLESSFGEEHERTYGHRAGPEEPVELVNVLVIGRAPAGASAPPRPGSPAAPDAPPGVRRAYHGPEIGWLDTPVMARGHLASGVEGPVIVEEYDATCLVPPGARARLDDHGNIRMDL